MPDDAHAQPNEALRPACHLCGAVIAAAACLPLAPDGSSFIGMLRAELARGLLDGVLMLAGFGSPFLFGLAVAIVASPKLRKLADEIVRTPIGLVHGQLLLVGFVVWRDGRAIAALPLFGFAVVGAIAYAFSGSRAPGGKRLPLSGTVRWGALVIAGVAGWCRLQRFAGIDLGIAVDVVLAAALLLAFLTARRDAPAAAG
ncbi:MAG TPA: hypothetical protein VG755_21280 [Nannocystaceae bacterium]|nr:hypothetical protein [Nannocystaceae bacterium]